MSPRLVVLVVLAALLPAAGPGLRAEPLCDPSPVAAALLEEHGDFYGIMELSARDWEERLAEVDLALAERPDDLFLHRLRQDLFRFARKDVREERMPAVREGYARLAAENPENPVFHYLLGRVADRASDQEEAAYRKAIEVDPGFPWGHLGMVSVELSRTEPAKEAAQAHLGRYAALCPHRAREILVYGGSVGSTEFWSERLPELRRRLEEDPAEHAGAFSSLWAVEFRVTDVAEHDAVRERVARDVERLAALEARPPKVLRALEEGYELTGRQEAAAETEQALRSLSPCSSESVYATLEAWGEEHPYPDASDEQAWEAWRRLQGEAAVEWIAECPDVYQFWSARFHSLEVEDGADPAEVLEAGLKTAELYGRWQGYAMPSGYEQVAEGFLGQEVGLDRVGELLDRAEAEVNARWEKEDLDRYPEERRADVERGRLQAGWSRELLRARARIAQGDLDRAEELLAALEPRLDDFAPPEDASGRASPFHRGLESELWKVRADLAEAADRLPDALAYLLKSESLRPAEASPWVKGLRPEEAEERIPELWARLGGSPAALEALRASRAAGELEAVLADFSPWEEVETALPEFELPDLSGRKWTLADLAGKTLFVNAWATWCGPCRDELPAVQALHEKLRDRDDVLVLTLNMDSNTGVIAPYVEKEGLSFPVLLAEQFLREDLDVFSIPRSWIVDQTGTLRREQTGFDPTVPEDEWIGEVIAEMEALTAAGGTAE